MTQPNVAMIGVGTMGAAAARSLAAAGCSVRCFDVASDAMEAVCDVATPSTSVADAAAGAAIVLLSLRTPDDVAEVTRQLRTSAAPDTVVVDLSTIDPGSARGAASLLADGGIDYLDAPVLGRPEAVGGWTIVAGGAAAAVGRVAPVLEGSIATRVAHVGPAGCGSIVKLMNNLMFGAINAVTAEVLAVCSAAGLDPGVFVDVVGESGAASVSGLFRDIGPKIVDGDFTPTFTVSLLHKDNELAVRLAEECRVPLLVGGSVHQLNTLARRRFGSDDSGAVVKVLEEATGVAARRGMVGG